MDQLIRLVVDWIISTWGGKRVEINSNKVALCISTWLSWWLSGCCSSVIEEHLQLKSEALGFIHGDCHFSQFLFHNSKTCLCPGSWLAMITSVCKNLLCVWLPITAMFFCVSKHEVTNDLIGWSILLSRELETFTRCAHYQQRDLPMQGNPSLIPRPHAALYEVWEWDWDRVQSTYDRQLNVRYTIKWP